MMPTSVAAARRRTRWRNIIIFLSDPDYDRGESDPSNHSRAGCGSARPAASRTAVPRPVTAGMAGHSRKG